MEWLDKQPPSRIVFLCFESMESFSEDQVKEMTSALEQNGHRFLWSLCRPPPKWDWLTVWLQCPLAGVAQGVPRPDGRHWKSDWMGPVGWGPGSPGNWGIRIALRMQIYVKEHMVWSGGGLVGPIRRAIVCCVWAVGGDKPYRWDEDELQDGEQSCRDGKWNIGWNKEVSGGGRQQEAVEGGGEWEE